MTEAPYFIALYFLASKVSEYVVLKVDASLTEFAGLFLDSVLGYPGNSGGGSNGATVNKASNDCTAFFVG
jgi:hypothetical protein